MRIIFNKNLKLIIDNSFWNTKYYRKLCKKKSSFKKITQAGGPKRHRVRLSQEIFAFFFKGKLYIMRGEKMASDNCVIAVNYSTAFLQQQKNQDQMLYNIARGNLWLVTSIDSVWVLKNWLIYQFFAHI